MFLDIFLISVMSSEFERKFSPADNMVIDEMSHLVDEMIETIELQNDWLQKRVVGHF